MEMFTDEYFMNEALKEAQKAYDADEVPVGAVIVCDNKIIARAHNLTERLNDVTAHGWSQISKIVYAASDDKKGFTKIDHQLLHPKTRLFNGIMQEPCSNLMKKFFKERRK